MASVELQLRHQGCNAYLDHSRSHPSGIFRRWSSSWRLPVAAVTVSENGKAVINEAPIANSSEDSYREEEHDRDFHLCSAQQQAGFAEEEEARWAGENRRVAEFEKLLLGINVDAESQERRHEDLVRELLQEQQESFTRHEAARQDGFTNSQVERKNAFQRSQARREGDLERHMEFRTARLEEGRKERNDICEAMKSALRSQHDSLFEQHETVFVENERRRNAAVQQMIQPQSVGLDVGVGSDPEVLPTHSVTVANDNDALDCLPPKAQPTNRENELEPEETPQIFSFKSSSSTPITREGLPLDDDELEYEDDDDEDQYLDFASVRQPDRRERPGSSDPLFDADDDQQEPVVHTVIHQPEILATRRPPSIITLPASTADADTQDPKPTHVVAIENPEPTRSEVTNGPLASLQEKFLTAQEHRAKVFQEAEKAREDEFSSNEEERDLAEDQRRERFEGFLDSVRGRFEDIIRDTEDVYRKAEALRNLTQGIRDQAYEDEISTMGTEFQVLLSTCRGMANTIEQQETLRHEALVNGVKALVERYANMYEQARKMRHARFSEAQDLRRKSLGVELSPRLPSSIGAPSQEPVQDDSTLLRPSLEGEPTLHLPTGPTIPPTMGSAPLPDQEDDEEVWEDVGIRHPPRSRRPASPPTGFAPQALFTNGNLPSLPLPLGAGEYVEVNQGPLPGTERDRQALYQKAKSQRDATFSTNSLLRQNLFRAAESKRQHEFMQMQAERRVHWQQMKPACPREFKEMINTLRTNYSKAESLRASKFIQLEIYMRGRFREAQVKSEETYLDYQDVVTKACFEQESKRIQDLRVWTDNQVTQAKADQMRAFEEEERKREELYLEMVERASGQSANATGL